MRIHFAEQLEELNRELITMGALCEEALGILADAMQSGEYGEVKGVFAIEKSINEIEREIEQLCLKLLLQQQPVARDLRQISAALKMITDMERIGDQTEDIADILMSGDQMRPFCNHTIVEMAQASMEMVTTSVDAYVKRSVSLAEDVIKQDDIVDGLFLQERNTLIAEIAKNPQHGDLVLDQLMIAKYFERIGDHAVNLANWVSFSLTGVHMTDTETE